MNYLPNLVNELRPHNTGGGGVCRESRLHASVVERDTCDLEMGWCGVFCGRWGDPSLGGWGWGVEGCARDAHCGVAVRVVGATGAATPHKLGISARISAPWSQLADQQPSRRSPPSLERSLRVGKCGICEF